MSRRQQMMVPNYGARSENFSLSPMMTMRQGLSLALIPSYVYNNAAEVNNAQALTPAKTPGTSLIGTVDDYSPSCNTIYSGSSGDRPTLTADGTLGACWTFAGSQGMDIPNSGAWADFISKTAVFTLMIWVRLPNVTGNKMILDSTNEVETTVGFMLRANGSGATVKITDGTSPPAGEVTLSSAFSANTWACIEVVGEGVGANKLKIAANGGAYTTATVNNTLSASSMSFALKIGNKANTSGTRLTGDIGPCFLWNRALTTNERAAFLAWRPGFTTDCPYTYSGGAITNCSHVRNGYLMHDSTYVRTTGDVAVSGDGDAIETVKNLADVLYSITSGKNLVVGSGATAPIWKIAANNFGLNVGGVGINDGHIATDKLTMGLNGSGGMRRSLRSTRICIFANQKASGYDASHMMIEAGAGTSYWTVVTDNYPSGDPPRWSYHDNDSKGPDGTFSQGMRLHDHFNILVCSRNGSAYRGHTNGIVTSTTSTSTFGVGFNQLGGTNSSPNPLEPWGHYVLVAELPWQLTDAEIATLSAYYTSQLGIT